MVQTDTARAIMLTPQFPVADFCSDDHKNHTSAAQVRPAMVTTYRLALDATKNNPAAGVGCTRRGRSHPLLCEVPFAVVPLTVRDGLGSIEKRTVYWVMG